MAGQQAPSAVMTQQVHGLLRAGLPVGDTAQVQDLICLRGVVARALEPGTRSSLIRALDGLLRWQLARFEHPRLGEAARILFGATRGASGLTLTERRARAAAASGYEVHHFRKRIEPEICARLAGMLSADAEDFTGGAAAPRLGRARRPTRLGADVFAWEVAEHEQALAALWSGVYALRAELLATARLASMNSPRHQQTRNSAQTALWRLALLYRQTAAYRQAYGPRLLGTDPNTAPEQLAHFAGWHPPVDRTTAAHLTALAELHPGAEQFAATLPSSPIAAEAEAWCSALTDPPSPTREEQQPWT